MTKTDGQRRSNTTAAAAAIVVVVVVVVVVLLAILGIILFQQYLVLNESKNARERESQIQTRRKMKETKKRNPNFVMRCIRVLK